MNAAVTCGFASALLWLAGGMAGCGGKHTTPREPVLVFAAASTTNALDEIKAAFQERSGVDVRTSYASSSVLARQIDFGAEPDLFISADLRWADYVEGKTPVAKRRNLLGNRLVIVLPSDSKLKLAQPEDLLAKEVTHLALGDPDAVPAGQYAKQAFARLGIWEKLKEKVAPAEDVRHALRYVETGAAEAGVVYATDAAISRKVKVALDISAFTEPVRYPVLLLKRGPGGQAAEEFYNYLGSPEAARVFEKFGFIVL